MFEWTQSGYFSISMDSKANGTPHLGISKIGSQLDKVVFTGDIRAEIEHRHKIGAQIRVDAITCFISVRGDYIGFV